MPPSEPPPPSPHPARGVAAEPTPALAGGGTIPAALMPGAASGQPCHPDETAARTRRGRERLLAVRRVFFITLALNLAVALMKAGYAYASGSVAVGADAIHSALDGASNILALIGIHLAASPPDPGHPYGHRKVEIIAALGIGVLIVFGLVEFVRAAVDSLTGARAAPVVGLGGFAVVLVTMGINLFVSVYEHRRGVELESPILSADAAHTRSDLYASSTVLLSFVAVRAGVPWADGAAALLLMALVARVAWKVFRDNVPALIDAAALAPEGLAATACGIPGVLGVHQVRSRGSRGAVHVDLHVEVASETTVGAAHALAHRIEDALRAAHPEIADVVIHIEPPRVDHDAAMARAGLVMAPAEPDRPPSGD